MGCSHSHYRAMKIAIENKWNKILILEDDFIFKDNIINMDNYFKNAIKSINDNWDCIMLYWHLNGINNRSIKINNFFRKPTHKKYGAFSTLGYAVNKNLISILMNLFLESYNILNKYPNKNVPQYLPCDKIWYQEQLNKKWYIITPKIGGTIISKSDIQ